MSKKKKFTALELDETIKQARIKGTLEAMSQFDWPVGSEIPPEWIAAMKNEEPFTETELAIVRQIASEVTRDAFMRLINHEQQS